MLPPQCCEPDMSLQIQFETAALVAQTADTGNFQCASTLFQYRLDRACHESSFEVAERPSHRSEARTSHALVYVHVNPILRQHRNFDDADLQGITQLEKTIERGQP